jgi:hypothetical protein
MMPARLIRPGGWRRLRNALAFGLGLGFLPCFATQAQTATEAQLKAAYLISFLKYVEWPAQQTSLTLCLFGREMLQAELAAYEGRKIAGRELKIRRVSRIEELTGCQEVFVPETESAQFAALTSWMNGRPILSISDSERFIRENGAISLLRRDGRLQFDVNPEAISRSGLKVSSALLRLARREAGGER